MQCYKSQKPFKVSLNYAVEENPPQRIPKTGANVFIWKQINSTVQFLRHVFCVIFHFRYLKSSLVADVQHFKL